MKGAVSLMLAVYLAPTSRRQLTSYFCRVTFAESASGAENTAHAIGMSSSDECPHGVVLPCGSRIVHRTAAATKAPFKEIPVIMSEFSPGACTPSHRIESAVRDVHQGDEKHVETSASSFSGQLGIVQFSTAVRLPRHVHISESSSHPRRFVAERIIVLEGAAIVELCGELYVIPPETMVHIAAGVPHTWTACPAGVLLVSPTKKRPRSQRPQEHGGSYDMSIADGGESSLVMSTGRFLMVYEYENVTAFYPTAQTNVLVREQDYKRSPEKAWAETMIPRMSAEDVASKCHFVW
jgi:quercetin dioxygenase-like cupin family protein